MESELLHYRTVLTYNREYFLLIYGYEFKIFEFMDLQLNSISQQLARQKSKKTQLKNEILPFLQIIVKQGRNAFELLSQYQSNDAWLTLRPAIESILYIGKFLDNHSNFELWMARRELWKNRDKNREKWDSYRKQFIRDNLISKSIQKSTEFLELLNKINNEFAHANYSYYEKSFRIRPVAKNEYYMIFPFIDENPDVHMAYVFAFIHMYYCIIKSLLDAFNKHYHLQLRLRKEISYGIENKLKLKTIELTKKKSELIEICKTLGLWEI
ncbi:hypothetical protein KAX02_08220 [candidate division WOR-3 bacterium]|nr:hypothetical protein [candidate division WOR-3 bacterium]